MIHSQSYTRARIRYLNSIFLAENPKYINIITIVSVPWGMSINYIYIWQQHAHTHTGAVHTTEGVLV